MKSLAFTSAIGALLFTACTKEKTIKEEFGDEEAIMTLQSGYDVNIVSAIEKPTTIITTPVE